MVLERVDLFVDTVLFPLLVDFPYVSQNIRGKYDRKNDIVTNLEPGERCATKISDSF